MNTEKIDVPSTPPPIDFSKQFLVAMPGMVSGSLADTVIYVCEHNEDGALGVVINRPTDLSVAELLERVELPLAEGVPAPEAPVYFGGPVQTDRGFVLHSPAGHYSSSIRLGDLALTTSRDVLQEVSAGNGPAHIFVTLGYAGWGAGQLEEEMAQNAWLHVDAKADLIFGVPPGERYQVALSELGIQNPAMLSSDVGHA